MLRSSFFYSIHFRTLGILGGLIFFFLGTTAQESDKHPKEVLAVLNKAGKNRPNLEKAIEYFTRSGDTLKLRAINFLIGNMDIHYSNDYYWADNKGKRLDFDELKYPDYDSTLKAINILKATNKDMRAVRYSYRDIDSIKADFLIDNVEKAFSAWKAAKYSTVSFEVFCEDILPYRVSTEPIQKWRGVYGNKFSWILDSARNKSTETILRDIAVDFKTWFTNTWDIEKRLEPLPRLGALQLLSRKKGNCDDIADLEVFTLRSEGYPARLENIPFWATTTGRHYFNSTINEAGENLPFDISTASVKINSFSREPSKVIRMTYSKQKSALVSEIAEDSIPKGFLRMPNFLDVTAQYWKTGVLSAKLFKAGLSDKYVYACVFNGFEWQATWWGRRTADSVVFENMCKGAVFLPMYYQKGKLVPAGNPIAFGYNHAVELIADRRAKQKVILKQQEKFLIYRPEANYQLYCWDKGWKLLGEQQAKPGATEMLFNDVPKYALLLLVPDYSEGKERPFIITDEGDRVWF